MPLPSGNGLAMRAASVLGALAQRFEVELFVIPVAGADTAANEFVRQNTARIGVLDIAQHLDPLFALIARVQDREARLKAELDYPKPQLSRFCSGESADFVHAWTNPSRIAAIHIMRLYLAPLIWPFLGKDRRNRPYCVLDLDDDDVTSNERLAQLHRTTGDARSAAQSAAEAAKYRAFADRYLPLFDRIAVASPADAFRLSARHAPLDLCVIPNTYDISRATFTRAKSTSRDPTLRLLLVGTLGYFPNVDAATFLCREILPVLRRRTSRPIAIDIAGSGDVGTLRELEREPGVVVHNFVEDLGALYARADVAVLPLRTGGGTRIKLLEAFAYRIPVVATRIAAEGVEAIDGTHLVIADDPEAFARACIAIKEQPLLAALRAERAAALLTSQYGSRQLDAAVAQVYSRATFG